MTDENFIKGQLVGVAVREALRHGGYELPLAIAQVMANRVRAGWYGGDWLRVLIGAAAVAGNPAQDMAPFNRKDLVFRTILHRIDDVYNGVAEDRITNGALYYCELAAPIRPWFQETIISYPGREDHPITASFFPITFFA